jgi:hypothetical protein
MNRLSMDERTTILGLLRMGWSERRVARETGYHRATIRRMVDYWNDYTALHAALAVAAACPVDVDLDGLRAWTKRESPSLDEKFAEFERRFFDAQSRS